MNALCSNSLELTRLLADKNVQELEMFLDLFDALACVYSGMDQPLKAARITGAADRCCAQCSRRRFVHNEREYAPYIAKARAALGDEAYEAARAEGHAMTLEEAIAYVLDEGK